MPNPQIRKWGKFVHLESLLMAPLLTFTIGLSILFKKGGLSQKHPLVLLFRCAECTFGFQPCQNLENQCHIICAESGHTVHIAVHQPLIAHHD